MIAVASFLVATASPSDPGRRPLAVAGAWRRGPCTPFQQGRALAAAGLGGVVLAALAACASQPSAPTAERSVLAPREGAVVAGTLAPGETATYALELPAGHYFEVFLDQTETRARIYLLTPEMDPVAGREAPYTWGEHHGDPPGQMMWEVMKTAGRHLLGIEAFGEPIAYRLRVIAARPATERDLARHQGLVRYGEAQAHRGARDFEGALAAYAEALELFERGGYGRGVASTRGERGQILLDLRRLDEAERELAAAEEAWRRVGHLPSVAGILIHRARAATAALDLPRASGLIARALAIARHAGAVVQEGNALKLLCLAEIEQGLYDEAARSCSQAIAIWEGLGRTSDLIDAVSNLGYLDRARGDLASARAHYERALELLAVYPNPAVEGVVRNNLAIVYENEGRYQEALESYHDALALYTEARSPRNAALALHNIGIVHGKLGDAETALAYFTEALARYRETVDLGGLIVTLHSLSRAYREQGDLERAAAYLDEALAESRRADAAPLVASSLDLLGELHLAGDRPGEALAPFTEALALAREMGDRWLEAHLLAELARVRDALGEPVEALATWRRAAVIHQEIGSRTGYADDLFEIARLQRRAGDLGAAREAIEQAIASADSVRPQVGGHELRALFAATTRAHHELYVDLLMEEHLRDPAAGHASAALAENERARARSLREVLAAGRLELGDEVPAELRQERAEILARLETVELTGTRGVASADGAAIGNRSLAAVRIEIRRLLTRLGEIDAEAQAASPRFAALTLPEAITLEELQGTLLDPETALLELSLGETRSWLWVVTRKRFVPYPLPGRARLEAQARCFHWLIAAYGDPPAGSELGPLEQDCLGDRLTRYRALGDEVSAGARSGRRRLLERAYETVARALATDLLAAPERDGMLPRRLAIVSDGALEYVPFSALADPAIATSGAFRPLIVEHETVRLPSASTLLFQRSSRRGQAQLPHLLAIIADPVYGLDDDRIGVLETATTWPPSPVAAATLRGAHVPRAEVLPAFSRLVFSGREAEALARLAPTQGTFVATGFEASRETALDPALGRYRYVHFATHGVIDTHLPQMSGLVLSMVDRSGRPRSDGFLRLHDIYGMALDADMVVLSACDTALGREIRGEGLVGLARGFMYAGAERVLASLWQVQDLATARLMESLYHGLLAEELPPASALRAAQLDIRHREEGRFSFPYYWAGFVVQGDWR